MHIMTAALTSPKDIELVMTLATCSRSTAVAALEANNFGRTQTQEDIVNAIMHIMTA
jgi:NACalpha-BTF3-like transcription factor